VRGPEATPPPLAAQIDEARSPGDGGYVPRVFGAGNENARVVLVAENDSWVQVRATSGELLLTRVLRPGDRYLVPDRPGLLLMTGNLGALEVIVDGVPIPRLGPVGVIGRDISLAVDDLRNRRGPVEAGTGGTQTDP
jgi:cytoskeleton protein RodZ